MDKKKLSEQDICLKFITPALQRAGWDINDQIFMNYTLRPGRMVVSGREAFRDAKTALYADYVLCFKSGMPIAAIEAKDRLQRGHPSTFRPDGPVDAANLPIRLDGCPTAFRTRTRRAINYYLGMTTAASLRPKLALLYPREPRLIGTIHRSME